VQTAQSYIYPELGRLALQAAFDFAPVGALTAISWRMGRRGLWLAAPWIIALVFIVPGLVVYARMAAKAGWTAGLWPMITLGAVPTGAAAAVLIFSIVLAIAGCSRLGPAEAPKGIH
jgi:hypothetical protein